MAARKGAKRARKLVKKGRAPRRRGARAAPRSKAKPSLATRRTPALLSGGNPQVAKALGDAPVQAYIAAMPDWKREIGRRLDALVTRVVPDVRKAVKWNSPFYGVEDRGWFLAFHCYTRFVRVTFFKGTSLDPMPPGGSKQDDVRYLDLHADDFDEERTAAWIRQAASIPGWLS